MARQCTRVCYGMHTLVAVTSDQLNKPKSSQLNDFRLQFSCLRNVKAAGQLCLFTVARTFELGVSFPGR